MESVRRLRTLRGMNQVELARASGVAQNTISEIELGKRAPRPGTLKKLADALGVEISDFFEEARPLAQAPPEQEAEERREPVEISAGFSGSASMDAELTVEAVLLAFKRGVITQEEAERKLQLRGSAA